MPWKIVENHNGCPSNKSFAVVVETTGKRVGCHDTRVSAEQQLKALYANDPGASKK